MATTAKESTHNIGFLSRTYSFVICYWRSLVVVITPVVLLPLLFLDNRRYIKLIYVTCLMFVWWVTEAIPIGITALLPVVLFPMMGVLDSVHCSNNFISSISIALLGSFVAGQSMEYCLLDQRIALHILRKVGCRPVLLHNILVTVSFFTSMWTMDIVVVALMCPIVQALLRELDMHGLCKQYDETATDSNTRPSGFALCFYLGVSMASIFGGCSTIFGTGANLVLVEIYQRDLHQHLSFAAFSVYAFPIMLIMVIFSTLYLQWMFLGLFGHRPSECAITPEDIARTKISIERESQELGPYEFHEKLVSVLICLLVLLLVTERPGIYVGWSRIIFRGKVSGATVTMFVFFLLVVMPSHLSFLNYFKDDSAYYPARRSRGAISWQYVMEKVPWKIIFVIGGSLILAHASKKVGLSYHISNQVMVLQKYPKIILLFIFCLPVFLLTQVIGNIPLAQMTLPILVKLAMCHEVHAVFFMIPVAIICSMSLTTPAGTGANALVVGYANIRGVDVAQIGALPAVLSFLLVWLSFSVFGVKEFPQEAQLPFNGSLCEEHKIVF